MHRKALNSLNWDICFSLINNSLLMFRIPAPCCVHACMHFKFLQSCLTVQPYELYPPGSSVHGILQAKILQWATMPSCSGPSWPRDLTHVYCISCIAGGFFTTEPLGKPTSCYKLIYNLTPPLPPQNNSLSFLRCCLLGLKSEKFPPNKT